MTITNDIKYVGVNDHDVDLFEGQYDVPNGMAYNSYVILDDKIAVMDTVEEGFGDEWLANIAAVLEGKKPDYLVISHMEPDHSANIKSFLEVYPDATVVGNAKIFTMMSQFFGGDITANKLTVSDKETLCLGKHTLQFIFAAMVHWPEVMVSYDSTDKVLFSADAFGKFGALDVEEDWDCEARRYYFGIVGKYGMMVQKLLKEVATLDVATVCPLHGPILTENLGHYIGQYDTWSSYRPENEGVFIAYASAHGNTKKAAQMLAAKLEAQGCPKVAISDLAREDMAECVEDAFRYDRLVLASITYNAGIFPCMKTFIDALTERGYQNRKIGFIENGSWAPMAKKIMQGMFEKSKNITFCEESVTIQSAVNAEAEAAIDRLAKELLNTAAAQPEE
ncbi:MAG: MBL fold metallo-hydrolase [Lachnospiraceae bacterium]|nr:MBL fold metallo-hydrolase [Lachnospiraceae bacterium]